MNHTKALILFLIPFVILSGCSRDPMGQRDKYFASGQKYLDNKKYEEASIEFRNALRIDDGHIPSYLGIAKAFQQMGNHQGAVAAFQQVIKLDGKNIEARLRVGEYQIAAGISDPQIFKQAQQMAEEVLKVAPSNIEALLLLGNAYAGQKEIDMSVRQYEKVLALDPDNLKATLNLAAAELRKNDLVQAEAMFDQALQKHPEAIEAHLAIAAFYLSDKRIQETENQLKQAFDIDPSDSRSVYALVSFYRSQNMTDDAEQVYKQAILKRPQDREPRWGLANFYIQQKKPAAAIEVLNEMLGKNPEDINAKLRIAELYMNQKDAAKADEEVRSVLALNKNTPEAHYLLGRLMLSKSDSAQAAQEFDAAIRLNPSMPAPYLEKANMLISSGDLQGAQGVLEALLQRDRSNLLVRGALAKVLAQLQKPRDALQQAQAVLASMPYNEDAIVASGDALRTLGKLQEAKVEYIKLSELQPQNPYYWHRLGSVEAMLGDSVSASVHFRKAVELRPEFTAAINDYINQFLAAKHYDAALKELDRLMNTSAPQDEIHRFRGQVYLSKENIPAAEAEFQKAVEINPQNYQIYILLGQLNLGRNNLPQAIREVDRLLSKNNKLAPAFLLKGYYLQIAKDIPGAIINYRKSLELDPENAVAANNLAWLLCENANDLEEAISLAKIAKKKQPEDPEVADTLGWVYYKMKNYTLAADQLLFSVNNRKQPKAAHYYRLGMALYAKGDLVLAKQSLKKALELDPLFSDAEEARNILKLHG